MTYVKTHWINNEEPSIDADNLNHMEQGIEDAQYPDGGNAGQLLAKTTNGTEWVDAPNSAVWGLIQGQLNEQEDLYAELESKIVAPTGGTTGQYLRKTAGGTEWADAGSIDTVNNISPDANKNVQTVIELTQAQYNALANPDPNVTYLITDGINNPANNTINSSGVSYDNTDSGLTATTVQGAIDENASAITDLNNGLTSLENNPVIVWKSSTRSNISHATGANYWTMNDNFPAKAGYTRKIFGISISDTSGSVVPIGTYFSGDTPVIRTRNVGSATVTIGITATYVYLKDSAQF